MKPLWLYRIVFYFLSFLFSICKHISISCPHLQVECYASLCRLPIWLSMLFVSIDFHNKGGLLVLFSCLPCSTRVGSNAKIW